MAQIRPVSDLRNTQYELMVARELRAADLEAESTAERFSHEEVMRDVRAFLCSAKTLNMMDKSIRNMKAGKVSGAVDLSDFRD